MKKDLEAEIGKQFENIICFSSKRSRSKTTINANRKHALCIGRLKITDYSSFCLKYSLLSMDKSVLR